MTLLTTIVAGLASAIVLAPPASAAALPTSTLYVSGTGTDTKCSTAVPCSLPVGQARARVFAAKGNNVNIIMAGGRYELTSPWRIQAADSGVADAVVTYRAATGATPVITGSRTVSGWAPSALGNNIYEAPTPVGLNSRQLYVDGKIAPRAQLAVPASALTLNSTGFTVNDPQIAALLQSVKTPSRLELEAVLSFTDRYSPVASISGNQVTMAQPAWNNNTYGYDILQRPFRDPQFTLQNAPQLLSAAGQWYIDSAAGRLYYRAADGQDPATLDVQLPTLQSVLQVSGTYDAPARNVVFKGLTFSGTSWLRPSSAEGFASQQTGSFLTGADTNRPADAFDSCRVGCAGFEATRGKWGMIAGGVQVSVAQGITFTGNTFTNLGSQALGVGNDAGGNASGADLGAQNITITGNKFTQVSGGAVIVGGTRADAHHPSDVRMTNKDIVITGNSISAVGVDYKDTAGIFATYVSGLTIDHNDISDVPYTAIAVGYGWGAFDAGGSNEYANRGTYNFYPRYAADNPTVAQDYRVTNNYMHNIVTRMNDAGCVYTLGSVPRSVIEGNYCRDAGNGSLLYSWPVYLDEGSANFTIRNNVFLDVPAGLHTNYSPTYSNNNLRAENNYLSANVANQDLTAVPNSSNSNLVAVTDPNRPIAASRIIFNSGLQTRTADAERAPLGAELSTTSTDVTPGARVTLSALLANLDPGRTIAAVKTVVSAPAGWTVTPVSKIPSFIPRTGTISPTWRVTAPATFTSTSPQTITLTVTYGIGADAYTLSRTVVLNPQTPVTSLATYTNAAMRFSQVGSTYSITGSSGDTFDGFGILSDSYGTVYKAAAAGVSSTTVVRVESFDKPRPSAKAGVVLRNDLKSPGSSRGYAAIMVQNEGVTMFDDPDGNGYLNNFQVDRSSPTTGPIYLRLVRTGTQVIGSWSTDGVTWVQVGSPVTLNSPSAILDAGMLWTTTDPAASGTATFDNFAVTNT